MRYTLQPIEENEHRSVTRFAWHPVRVGWSWVWLEWYTQRVQWLDVDGDGVYQWETMARDTIEPTPGAVRGPSRAEFGVLLVGAAASFCLGFLYN